MTLGNLGVGRELQESRPHFSREPERALQGASEDAAADGSPGQGDGGVSTVAAVVGIQAAAGSGDLNRRGNPFEDHLSALEHLMMRRNPRCQ
jgi:hypothetical protein